jgi:hypothetical protein
VTEPQFTGSEGPSQQPYPPSYQGQQARYPGQPAPYPPPGGYPGAAPGAPFGVDMYGRPLSDKSKLTAGLLQIFLGGFGVGRFYLGYTNIGVLQLVVTLVTCGFGSIWGLIDGIVILIGNVPDPQGRPLRD